jgi:alpha-amylase
MASVCFYFQVHQPYRLRHYTIFDNGPELLRRLQERPGLPQGGQQVLPADQPPAAGPDPPARGRFRIAYSITGVSSSSSGNTPRTCWQLQDLAETGCVEFLAETYYHSLSFLYSPEEFAAQVRAHRTLIRNTFGQTPRVFRNTELIYNNDWPRRSSGWAASTRPDRGRRPHPGLSQPELRLPPAGHAELKLLLKNYRLSDDIAFRFSNRGWSEWPLTAEKFAHWVNQVNGNGVRRQPVHGLRDLRRAPVGGHRHLRVPAPPARRRSSGTPTTTSRPPARRPTAYEAVDVVDVPT